MKISYSWLREYLNFPIEPDRINDILTNTGLEVDDVERVETVKGGLEGLLIGKVLEVEPHPNADKLKLTSVDVGNNEALNIVCGAPNVDEGQKVVVAPVGAAIYPSEGEPFKIKKAKIRGEESRGMICAEDEIGLGHDHEGILVLEDDAEVGKKAREHFGIQEEVVFDIDITPNRADATSFVGVARDLVAYRRNEDKGDPKAAVQYPEVNDFKVDDQNLSIQVEVEDAEACPRYCGLTMTGLKVGPSPEWLQTKLRSIDLAPINNVVDVTNYVLHELGQPLHAFDANKVKGEKVVVKKLKERTKFITLDEEERELTSDDLMICNEEEGMCIAGVFGGIESGVTEETTSIFLESAYFEPGTIRRTSKRHGLHTDASFRFERGIDPNITVHALKRAALLIKEVAGGKVSMDIVDHYPQPLPNHEVQLDFDFCDRLVGQRIDRDLIRSILTSLEIQVKKATDQGIELSVPAYRVDVTRPADVVEEILRIYGYDQIQSAHQLSSALSYVPRPDKKQWKNKVATILNGNGLHELMNNSLTNSEYVAKAQVKQLKEDFNVPVLNPISSDLDTMRQTMLFSGLESLAFNINRKEKDLKCFEFGRTYRNLPEEGYVEHEHLALFLTGKAEETSWNNESRSVGFFDLKGQVEQVLQCFDLEKCSKKGPAKSGLFVDGMTYKFRKSLLVEFGWVNPSILEMFDIEQEVFFAEFNWDHLMELAAEHQVRFSPIPKILPVRRDLSLLLDQKATFQEIEELAFQADKNLLREVDLFDVYEGKNIAEGKKSYAVSFTLQDPEKTLTDKQIDKTMGKIRQRLEEQLGAEVRDG